MGGNHGDNIGALRAQRIAICCLFALLTFAPRSIVGVYQRQLLNAFNPGDGPLWNWQVVQGLVWGGFAPIVGAMADRFGAMRVACAGFSMSAIGLFSLVWSTSPENIVASGGVVIGVGMAASSFAVMSLSLATSGAFGLLIAAAALGALLFTPLAFALVAAIGWSGSVSVFIGLMILGAAAAAACASTADVPTAVQDPAAGAKSRKTILLLASLTAIAGFHFALVSQRFQKFSFESSISANTGAIVFMLVCAASVVGALLAGFSLSRWRASRALTLVSVNWLMAVAALFGLSPGQGAAFATAALTGLGWMSFWPPLMAHLADLKGELNFGRTIGFCMLAYQSGGLIGGFMHARFANTGLLWVGLSGLAFAAVCISLSLDRSSGSPITRPAGSNEAK